MHVSHAGIRAAGALAALLVAGSAAATSAAAAEPAAAKPAPVTRPVLPEPRGKVVSRIPLSVRERPTVNSRRLGSIKPGTFVRLHCKVRGQDVGGNRIWYLLGDGRPGFVSARYVANLSPVPWCAVK